MYILYEGRPEVHCKCYKKNHKDVESPSYMDNSNKLFNSIYLGKRCLKLCQSWLFVRHIYYTSIYEETPFYVHELFVAECITDDRETRMSGFRYLMSHDLATCPMLRMFFLLPEILETIYPLYTYLISYLLSVKNTYLLPLSLPYSFMIMHCSFDQILLLFLTKSEHTNSVIKAVQAAETSQQCALSPTWNNCKHCCHCFYKNYL